MLSIGVLAKEAGVKVPTIRYYEQIGLLEAPPRTEGQQRRYGAEAVLRDRQASDGLTSIRSPPNEEGTWVRVAAPPQRPRERASSPRWPNILRLDGETCIDVPASCT